MTKPAPPQISVIIPCLDVEDVLPRQLEALARQQCTRPWELILVDNGSHDRTVEVAEAILPRFAMSSILTAVERGRQHACNAGGRAARGEYLVFVDADDEASCGFLEAMGDALDRADFVGGRLEHRRLNPGASATVGAVQTEGLMSGFGFLPYASGGCQGIRRSAFEALGGFATDCDYCEDVELSWRAQLSGYDIAFATDAVVSVRQRTTRVEMYRQHFRFGEAQALLYRDFRRHGMPRRPLRDVVADWWRIVSAPLFLRNPAQSQRWIRRLGRALGRLRGSVRYRVLYP